MKINEIIKILPHAYPFVLIDRVITYQPNEFIIAIKNVTFNEPFFTGHYPNNPVMPGVLIIEAMAQSCALCSLSDNKVNDTIIYLTSIESAKFRIPVIPGDTLRIESKVLRQRHNICKFSCIATVENKEVAESTITAMITKK